MVSEFSSAACGRLSHLDIQTGRRVYAMENIQDGSSASNNGYWNSELMLAQVINKACPIFEKAYLDHIAVFPFDNSSGYACKAEVALVASRMNLNPGGKQPLIRDTTFTFTGPGYPLRSPVTQRMVFQPGNYNVPPHLLGESKGMKRLLQERGLWIEGLNARWPSWKKRQLAETEEQYMARASGFQFCLKGGSCCAFRVIELQLDFLAEKSLLQIEITKNGLE